MATHALTTSTLLPATPQERLGLLGTQQARRSLLPAGPGRTPGPVTLAIQGVRLSYSPSWEMQEQQLADEHRALAALKARIASRIEADLALLDALDGDPDFEVDALEEQHDAEDVSLCMQGGPAA